MGAHGERALADAAVVLDIVRADYAGWPTKSEGPLAEATTQAEASMLAKARAAETPTDHYFALADYTDAFKDAHLRIAPQVPIDWPNTSGGGGEFLSEDAAVAAGLPAIAPGDAAPTSREDFAARLGALGTARDPIEAIWSIDGDRYVVGVIRGEGGDVFEAEVLSSTAEGWAPGQRKALFAGDGQGGYVARYLAGDKSASVVAAQTRANGQMLDLGWWGLWARAYPNPIDPQLARRMSPDNSLTLERLPDGTLWMRVPSFNVENASAVRDLLEENRALLEESEYFVVDVRNNGGGGDSTYAPLLPFILTGDYAVVGVAMRTTERNIAAFGDTVAEILVDDPEEAEAFAAELADVQRRAQEDADGDGFTSMRAQAETVVAVEPAPGNRHVAVLIDNAGSSAEQFVLAVQDADNVVTFGKENTYGVLDYSNVVSEMLPSGIMALNWPVTRSLRLPDNPVDDEGIAPEVRLGAEVDDPVTAALEWLKANP